jgi:hypothetical protein
MVQINPGNYGAIVPYNRGGQLVPWEEVINVTSKTAKNAPIDNPWWLLSGLNMGQNVKDFGQGFSKSMGLNNVKLPGFAKNITAKGLGATAGRYLPYAPVAMNVMEGDLGGTVQSGIGTVLGGMVGGPPGALVGGLLGEPVIGGAMRLADPWLGFGDPSDPYSGREGFHLFGKPMSQIEKTKRRLKRATDINAQVMKKYQDISLEGAMKMASVDMLNRQMANISSLMSTAMSNPYGR